jgi:hypothetical protein
MAEEFARDAIAHEEEAPRGKVRTTFRVVLARQDAETLAARAIREEKNIRHRGHRDPRGGGADDAVASLDRPAEAPAQHTVSTKW